MNQIPAITLVLLPGMDGTGDLFKPLLAVIQQKFPVLVIGYPTLDPLGYPELESIVRAALPVDRPYVILGESFSGPIAISLAASSPPHLKGLILCCTFVRNPRPRLSRLSFLVNALPLPMTSLSVRLLCQPLLGRFSTAELRRAFLRAVAMVNPTVLRARLRSVFLIDVANKLAMVAVPTLYLRASRDQVVPSEASKLIAKLKPDICVIDIDAPHLLLQTAPSEAAQLIGVFIQKLMA